MGVGIAGYRKGSSSSYDTNYVAPPPNPDPSKYDILDYLEKGEYLILKLKYHGCTNYEGVKILVFKGITLRDIFKQKKVDPHFSNSKTAHHPIARFVPTAEGWKMAEEFVSFNTKAIKVSTGCIPSISEIERNMRMKQ